MDQKEFAKYFSWCESRQIRFFAVPYNSTGTILKIALEKKGVIKIGEEKFKPETVAIKIRELYKQIFTNNNTNKPIINQKTTL